MASIKLRGDTSGELVIEAPAVAGTNTLTLPAASGNILTDAAALPAIDGSALTGISSYADSDALSLFNASGSAPVYAPRAWVSWDGGSSGVSTIFGSGNVSSVTDNGTGQSTINFTTALPNANYAVVGMATGYTNYCNENMVIQSANASGNQNPTTKTTSAVRVAYGHANTGGLAHIGYLTLVVIG